MADEFPAEILQFIDQNIESIAQLEALLLLHKDSQRQWSADEIAKALYITRDMADSLLVDMGRRGFARLVLPADARYSYQPRDADADRRIGQLASIYQDRRVAVISLIYSRPINKVQTFADAFRLRKEDSP
ncbi:MAG: hypothetical protein WD669_06270 [Pirellulales bacterium]